MNKPFLEQSPEERADTLELLENMIAELKELSEKISPGLFESIQEKYETQRNIK